MHTIERDGLMYVDQLSTNYPNDKVHSKSLKKYLRDKYSMTDKQYYDKVVYDEDNHTQLCRYCGSPTEFVSVRLGYKSHCSRSCISKETTKAMNESGTNPFSNKDFIERNRIRASEYQKSRITEGTHHFQTRSYEDDMIVEYHRFLSYGYSSARLYVCKLQGDNSKLKVGITGVDSYNSRQNYKGYLLYDHEYLLEGLPEDIASLELRVKKELRIEGTEFIKSDDLQILKVIVDEYRV